MAISLFVKPSDISRVALYHPATKEKVGTLLLAGPEHEATKAWVREINDRRQRRGYKSDASTEAKEALCRRTVGWEDVKDSETCEPIPFDAKHLSALYSQDWLELQVLSALSEEDFFFKE